MPTWKTKACVFCGTVKKIANGGKFCSHKCQQAKQREDKRELFESGKLKLITNSRLILHFLKERDGYECSCCGITEWNNSPISLDVDHIDGNIKNNLPENLRFLCPNCHRQTHTWGNKNRDSLVQK